MKYQVLVDSNGIDETITQVRSIFLQQMNVAIKDSWFASLFNIQNFTYYSIESDSISVFGPSKG